MIVDVIRESVARWSCGRRNINWNSDWESDWRCEWRSDVIGNCTVM